MTQIKFIDTTLRDGQQSMWALNMRTGMMMPVLADMDAAGFEAIEFFLPTVQGLWDRFWIRTIGKWIRH